MEFTVRRDVRPAATVLAVEGELDLATVQLLREQVQQALAEAPAAMYLDLSDTAFIDSTGCRELVRAAKSCRAAQIPVELIVPAGNWRVRRVVDFMKLGELLPVRDDLPTA